MKRKYAFPASILLAFLVLVGLVAYTGASVTAQTPEPGKKWETRIVAETVHQEPVVTGGSVITSWIEYAWCGNGSAGEGWPATFSYITYQGGVIATQTHILWTSSWARVFRFIDDLHAPPEFVVQWGTGSAMNINYPQPGLPLVWEVTQEASDNSTGAQLLYKDTGFRCPSVDWQKPIAGTTTALTVTEANATSFGLQIAGGAITNTSGVFTHTFVQTGEVVVTATAYGLGTSVSKQVTVTVEPPPQADLAIAAIPSELVARDQVFQLRIWYQNNGPDEARGTILTVEVPSAFEPNGTLIYRLLTVPAGGSGENRVNLSVNRDATPGLYPVTATINSEIADPNPVHNRIIGYVRVLTPTSYLPLVARNYPPPVVPCPPNC